MTEKFSRDPQRDALLNAAKELVDTYQIYGPIKGEPKKPAPSDDFFPNGLYRVKLMIGPTENAIEMEYKQPGLQLENQVLRESYSYSNKGKSFKIKR